RLPAKPVKQILDLLRMDGLLAPAILVGAFGFSSLAVLVGALLFRDFLDFATVLAVPQQRVGAAAMLLGFLILLMMPHTAIARGVLRFGRKLEIRIPALFLHNLSS